MDTLEKIKPVLEVALNDIARYMGNIHYSGKKLTPDEVHNIMQDFTNEVVVIVQKMFESGIKFRSLKEVSCTGIKMGLRLSFDEYHTIGIPVDRSYPLIGWYNNEQVWSSRFRDYTSVVAGCRAIDAARDLKIATEHNKALQTFNERHDKVRDINDRFNAIPEEIKDYIRTMQEYFSLPLAENFNSVRDQSKWRETPIGFPVVLPLMTMESLRQGPTDWNSPRITADHIKWEDYDPKHKKPG